MPRAPQFRGENFRGKWSLGSWAESHIIRAINESNEFRALPYGKSGVGPTGKQERRTYWEEYRERESRGKRPDILVFEKGVFDRFAQSDSLSLLNDLPNKREDEIRDIINNCLLGIESECNGLEILDSRNAI